MSLKLSPFVKLAEKYGGVTIHLKECAYNEDADQSLHPYTLIIILTL